MYEWIELIFCMLISVRKLKVTMGMDMIKYGCDALGPGTLKSTYLKSKLMNWANFLHAASDVIMFG